MPDVPANAAAGFRVFCCRCSGFPGVVRFCDCVCDYPCSRDPCACALPLLQCPACEENVFSLFSGIYVLRICWTTCILSQNRYFTVILPGSSKGPFFKCLQTRCFCMSFMLDISWREDFLMMKCVCAGVAVAGEPFCCVLGTLAKVLFWLVRGRYGKCVVPADECHRWMAGGYGERN